VQQNGRMLVLVTSQYHQNLEQMLSQGEASVTAIERMTLEEIFLTSVSVKKELIQ